MGGFLLTILLTVIAVVCIMARVRTYADADRQHMIAARKRRDKRRRKARRDRKFFGS